MPDAVVDPVVEANCFLTGAYIFVVQIIRKKKNKNNDVFQIGIYFCSRGNEVSMESILVIAGERQRLWGWLRRALSGVTFDPRLES